jgi:hypothetical protein
MNPPRRFGAKTVADATPASVAAPVNASTRYAIFTSYASVDGSLFGGKPLRKFRKLLVDGVVAKVARVALNEVIFVDVDAVKLGDEWDSVLADNVRTAEVMVCFMSPRYLDSHWCGRELEVFVRRLDAWRGAAAAAGAGPARFVFPIFWEAPDRELPKKLAHFHPKDPALPASYLDGPGIPANYVQNGVRQLANLNGESNSLKKIAEALADRIAETLKNAPPLPPADPIASFVDFPSAFADAPNAPPPPRPYGIAMLAAMPDGDAWRASAAEQTLAQAVEGVASLLKAPARTLESGPGIEAALTNAQNERQVILLVTPSNSGAADPLVARINSAASLPNLALLVVHTAAAGNAVLTAEAWAQPFGSGNFGEAVRANRATLTGPRELLSNLETLLTRVQRQVIQRDEPARVEDTARAATARQEGVPIDQKSNLGAPGGAKRS